VAVVLYSLLQLAALLVHVAQVGVGLSQHRILLDGQGAEVGRSGRTEVVVTRQVGWRDVVVCGPVLVLWSMGDLI
jgi:hypothetical protein